MKEQMLGLFLTFFSYLPIIFNYKCELLKVEENSRDGSSADSAGNRYRR